MTAPDGVLPYIFSPEVPAATRALVEEVARSFEGRTNIKMVPRTDQKLYLRFTTNGSGCGTYVGLGDMPGGQEVTLGPGCDHAAIS